MNVDGSVLPNAQTVVVTFVIFAGVLIAGATGFAVATDGFGPQLGVDTTETIEDVPTADDSEAERAVMSDARPPIEFTAIDADRNELEGSPSGIHSERGMLDTDGYAGFEENSGSDLASFDVEPTLDPLVQGEDLEVAFHNALDETGEPFTGAQELSVEVPGESDTETRTEHIEVSFEDGEAASTVLEREHTVDRTGAWTVLSVERADDESVSDVYDIEIVPPDQPVFRLNDIDPADTTVPANESFDILVTVDNVGSETGVKDVELRLDGKTIANEDDVELAGDSSVEVTFADVSIEDADEYDLSAATEDDEITTEITVLGPPDFRILDADMPVDVGQGHNVTVDFIIENEGSHGTQLVNFTVYAPEDDDDGDEEELIDASVAVVDDPGDTTLGEAFVDLLGNEYETVDLVTNDDVLDEMADYDVIVVYNFVTDTLAEDFLDELEADQGVVYLDDPEIMWPQEYWADGMYRLHNVRDDPGHRDSITVNASGDPPEVTITAAHPIFDGVDDVGETVILNDNTERATGGSWFGAYSGDVLAEVDYGVNENADDVDEDDVIGPGIGVNEDENEVLLPAVIHRNELEHITEEGEALVVNSVAHVAPDTDVGDVGGEGDTGSSEYTDGADAEFPFYGDVVIHVWDELTLDAGGTTTLELEYEVPENLAPDRYTQELSTENDTVISELWVETHADIEVSSYSLDPDPAAEDLTVGDNLTAEAVLANHGDRPDEFEVEYIVDDDVVATETVEVDDGATETVELDHQLRESGTKIVSVNGVDPVQIDVEPGPQADIEVESYSLDPDPEAETLYVDETLTAEANLTNHGERAGEFEVEYIIDEEVISNETVEVAADSTVTVELDHELRESGTKIVSVNGVDPTQIFVESEPEADIEVTSYTLDPDPTAETLYVDETLTAEAILTNHGDASGEFEVEYIVDEEVVNNETVKVDADSTVTVELDHELRETGTKIFSINGVDPIQLFVESGPEADIEVESYSLDPDPEAETLYVGATLTAEAILTNHGDASGEFEMEYIIDEEVISNETVEVAADSSETVELNHELRESGTKITSVNGVDPIQIYVEPPLDVGDYAGNDDTVDTAGLLEAVEDWQGGTIETELLRDVVDYWRSGEEVS